MTTNPVHSASQSVEFITAHALLVVADDALDRAQVSCSEEALEVVFPRVVGSDHGDEGLRMTFPIGAPRGCRYLIHRQGLDRFVNPADSSDEVLVARDPNPPVLVQLQAMTFRPGEDTIPADLRASTQDEWAEYLSAYLYAFLQRIDLPGAEPEWSPHRWTTEGAEMGRFTDEGALEDAEELLSEPLRYFHWSRYDRHFVAEYDGAGCIVISEVCFDDYYPSEAHELAELVDQDVEAWFAEARKVEYRYNPSIGWEYRRASDHDWETVCDA